MADFREKILVGQLAACAADMREATAMARRVAAQNEAALARLSGLGRIKRLQTITVSAAPDKLMQQKASTWVA